MRPTSGALGAVVATLVAFPTYAVSTRLPAALEVAGARLELASCGVRRLLWLDFYSAGLYLAPSVALDAALDPAQPAALAVKVLNWRNFPDEMPAKWRRPLAAALEPAAMARVLAAYGGLRDADLFVLTYAPRKGTWLTLNGDRIAHASGHRVIDAMLRVWAGDDPLADKLRHLALEHPCAKGNPA